jgi:hypothetical protein
MPHVTQLIPPMDVPAPIRGRADRPASCRRHLKTDPVAAPENWLSCRQGVSFRVPLTSAAPGAARRSKPRARPLLPTAARPGDHAAAGPCTAPAGDRGHQRRGGERCSAGLHAFARRSGPGHRAGRRSRQGRRRRPLGPDFRDAPGYLSPRPGTLPFRRWRSDDRGAVAGSSPGGPSSRVDPAGLRRRPRRGLPEAADGLADIRRRTSMRLLSLCVSRFRRTLGAARIAVDPGQDEKHHAPSRHGSQHRSRHDASSTAAARCPQRRPVRISWLGWTPGVLGERGGRGHGEGLLHQLHGRQ